MPDNKARARAFWTELFNAHDLGKIRSFLAPGFVNHNARPGTPDGAEGARQVFSRLWAGCSDMHFDVQAMVSEGGKVVCIARPRCPDQARSRLVTECIEMVTRVTAGKNQVGCDH